MSTFLKDQKMRSSFLQRPSSAQKLERPQQPNKYVYDQQYNYFIREIDKKQKKVAQLKANLRTQKSSSTEQQQVTVSDKLIQVQVEIQDLKEQRQHIQEQIKDLNKHQLVLETKKDFKAQHQEEQEKVTNQIKGIDQQVQEISDKIKLINTSTSDRISLKGEIDDLKTKKINLIKTTQLNQQDNFESKEKLFDKSKLLDEKMNEQQRKSKIYQEQIEVFKSKQTSFGQTQKSLQDQIQEANTQIQDLEKQKEGLQQDFDEKYQKWEVDYQKWKEVRGTQSLDTRKVTPDKALNIESLNTITMDSLKTANNQIEIDVETDPLHTQPSQQPKSSTPTQEQTPTNFVRNKSGVPDYSQVKSSGYGQFNRSFSSRKSSVKDRGLGLENQEPNVQPQRLSGSFMRQSQNPQLKDQTDQPIDQNKQSMQQQYEEKLILCENLLSQLKLSSRPSTAYRSLSTAQTLKLQDTENIKTPENNGNSQLNKSNSNQKSTDEQHSTEKKRVSIDQRGISSKPIYSPEQTQALNQLGIRVPQTYLEAKDITLKIDYKKEQLENLVARLKRKEKESSTSKDRIERPTESSKSIQKHTSIDNQQNVEKQRWSISNARSSQTPQSVNKDSNNQYPKSKIESALSGDNSKSLKSRVSQSPIKKDLENSEQKHQNDNQNTTHSNRKSIDNRNKIQSQSPISKDRNSIDINQPKIVNGNSQNSAIKSLNTQLSEKNNLSDNNSAQNSYEVGAQKSKLQSDSYAGTSSFENIDRNLLNQNQTQSRKPTRISLSGRNKSLNENSQNQIQSQKQEQKLKSQNSLKQKGLQKQKYSGTVNKEKQQEQNIVSQITQNQTQNLMSKQAQVEQDKAKIAKKTNGRRNSKDSSKGDISFTQAQKEKVFNQGVQQLANDEVTSKNKEG